MLRRSSCILLLAVRAHPRVSIRNPVEREATMDDATYQSRLDELVERVESLPPDQRERLQKLVEETKQRHEEIRDAGERAQIALKELTLMLQLAVLSRAGFHRGA